MRTAMCFVVVFVGSILIALTSVSAYQTATSFQFPLSNWNVGCNDFWSNCNVPNAYHLGEDVSASATTPVYACANGYVREAQSHGGYGGTVIIEHYTGTEHVTTITGHLKANTLAVSAGDEVSKGQLIGYVGTTAENGGWPEHVHFGIHKGSYQTGNSCDNHWVYAGYDYSGCTQNNWYVPTDFVNSHQNTYSCAWVSQTISPPGPYVPGQTVTCQVVYRNTGTATWYKNTNDLPTYVELESCDGTGVPCYSFFNSPCTFPNNGQVPSWLNCYAPCTFAETNVPHNGYATFNFTGKIKADATPGSYPIYFAPIHTGAHIPGWNSNTGKFQIQVINPVYYDDFAVLYDYGNTHICVQAFLADATSFNYHEWFESYSYTGSHVIKQLGGDFDGDGRDDVAVLYRYADHWFHIQVFKSTGTSFDYYLWYDSQTYTPDFIIDAAAADFNGDGKCDIAVLYSGGNPNLDVQVFLSTGSSFQYQLWFQSSRYTGTYVRFVSAGDYTGDGRADLAVFYDYGGSHINIQLFQSTGSSFDYYLWYESYSYTGDHAYQMASGYFDGDNRADLAILYRYAETTLDLQMFRSTGSSFEYQLWYQSTRYTSDFIVASAAGNFDGAGYDDIAVMYSAGGTNIDIQMFRSTGTSFEYDLWYQSSRYTPGFVHGMTAGNLNDSGLPKRSVDDQTPAVFSLSHSYPNPFNPTTTISYTLPTSSHVRIDIYNILGQNISTLIDATQNAGEHQVIWNAHDQPSGVYFYRLTTDTDTQTQKMLLLK